MVRIAYATWYNTKFRRLVMAKQKAYFGLSWIVSVILALIPVTNIICGVLTRFQRKEYLGIVLNILLAPLFYIVDIITIILKKDLVFLA